jgi:hypothetical protein
MRKVLALLIVMLALAISVAPAMAQDDAAGAAYVRIAHFSPDTPPVFIFAGEELVTSVRFPNISRWIELAPGAYEFTVSTTSDPANPDASKLSAEFADGDFVTVAAVGSLDRGTLKFSVIAEDFSRITTGQSRVTVLHAIEGAPVVDVRANGNVVIPALGFPGSLGSNDGVETISVPAGTYDLTVTSTAFPDVTVLSAPATALTANVNYFVAAVGTASDPQLVVVATDQAEKSAPVVFGEGEARVRVAHMVAGGPAVTIFVNGEIRFSGLRYATMTRFVPLAPGTYEVIVSTNSNPANAIIGPVDLTFADGSFTTIAAIGPADAIEPLVVVEDYSSVAEGESGITVVHAIKDAPAIDVLTGEDNSVQLVNSLSFPGTFLTADGTFNDGVVTFSAPAGTYTLNVVPAGATSPVVLSREVTLEAGTNYIIIASGSLADGTARLNVVGTSPEDLVD